MTAELLCGVLTAGGLVLVLVTVAAVRIAMRAKHRAYRLQRDLNKALTDLARAGLLIPPPRTPTHDTED